MTKQVLIIYSNTIVCSEIRQALEGAMIKVIAASTFDDAIRNFVNNEFCLIIMDAALSEAGNHQLLRIMRITKSIPILVLSSKVEYPDRLQAFQAGASAYLGKPYELEECIAQARSLIGLYSEWSLDDDEQQILSFGRDMVIDVPKHKVFLKGNPIELTRIEFSLLLCLASHAGQVLSREQLYNRVWNADTVFNVDEVVKSHIKTLRKKLASSDTDYIKNIWGVGYCFSTKKDGE